MIIPNFHDGHFNGFRLGADKSLQLFLQAGDERSYTIVLKGAHALTLSEIKQGNIILDLTVRGPGDITSMDIAELYDSGLEAIVAQNLLNSAREKRLQVLELNPSHGARGLVLFETLELDGNL